MDASEADDIFMDLTECLYYPYYYKDNFVGVCVSGCVCEPGDIFKDLTACL